MVSHAKVVGKGTIQLSKTLTLYSVLFVLDLECNLLTVSKLNKDLNCETKFLVNSCVFQDLELGRMIDNEELCAGLYILKVDQSPIIHVLRTQCQTVNYESNMDSAIMLWHFRLGHLNFMYLKHLLPSLFNNNDRSIIANRSNYSPSPYGSSHPFSLIHGDIWGPTQIPNVTSAQWFLSLVDDDTSKLDIFYERKIRN